MLDWRGDRHSWPPPPSGTLKRQCDRQNMTYKRCRPKFRGGGGSVSPPPPRPFDDFMILPNKWQPRSWRPGRMYRVNISTCGEILLILNLAHTQRMGVMQQAGKRNLEVRVVRACLSACCWEPNKKTCSSDTEWLNTDSGYTYSGTFLMFFTSEVSRSPHPRLPSNDQQVGRVSIFSPPPTSHPLPSWGHLRTCYDTVYLVKLRLCRPSEQLLPLPVPPFPHYTQAENCRSIQFSPYHSSQSMHFLVKPRYIIYRVRQGAILPPSNYFVAWIRRFLCYLVTISVQNGPLPCVKNERYKSRNLARTPRTGASYTLTPTPPTPPTPRLLRFSHSLPLDEELRYIPTPLPTTRLQGGMSSTITDCAAAHSPCSRNGCSTTPSLL